MSVTIDSLDIQIRSSAGSAAQNIENLAQALSHLNANTIPEGTAAGTYTGDISGVRVLERPYNTFLAAYEHHKLIDLNRASSQWNYVYIDNGPVRVYLSVSGDEDEDSSWAYVSKGTKFVGTVTIYGRKPVKL